MKSLRACALVALAGLLSACQSQQPQEGAYVDFLLELMAESAKQSEGPDDAAPALQAVETWRGTGEQGDD